MMPHDHNTGEEPFLKTFTDPESVASYHDGTRRFVPGLDALLQMTTLLLAENAPVDAKVLVLGAGGGTELRRLADAHPGWTFVGVDPAAEMLRLAQCTIGPHKDRVELIEGYIDDAPAGPFDAATCLLTLHFLPETERQRTIKAVHDRLHQGAPFVVAHASFPQAAGERDVWLDRYAAYATASGADPTHVQGVRAAVAASLNTFTQDADEHILRAGGFADVSMFFAALSWRGWIAHA